MAATKQERLVKAYGAFVVTMFPLAGMYILFAVVVVGRPLSTPIEDVMLYILAMVMFTLPFAVALHFWFRGERYNG